MTEIERLREEVERLRGPAQCWKEHYEEHVSIQEKLIEKLRSRVEVLETALSEIMLGWENAAWCAEIADRALKK